MEQERAKRPSEEQRARKVWEKPAVAVLPFRETASVPRAAGDFQFTDGLS